MTDQTQNPEPLARPRVLRPGDERLVEDFGDVVDRREYLGDDPDFGFPLLNPFSVLSDRQEGKFWPVYQSEQDLARIRGRARNLVTLTPTHTGVLDALANYVLGSGFTFTACVANPGIATTGAATAEGANLRSGSCRGQIDPAFSTITIFDAEVLDREAHTRSREDGEAFLVLAAARWGRRPGPIPQLNANR